jgi:hypothetical protein
MGGLRPLLIGLVMQRMFGIVIFVGFLKDVVNEYSPWRQTAAMWIQITLTSRGTNVARVISRYVFG